jgi:pilus assembly protein CpaB
VRPARRRRRGLILLALALVCGWVAASDVRGTERRARVSLGPLATAVVARQDLPAGKPITAAQLALRTVPARFLPSDALASSADAVGLRAAIAVPRGAYITASELGSAGQTGDTGSSELAPGQRAVSVTVAGSAGALGSPGGRVDVLVTTGAHGDVHGRTYLAIQDVQLLAVRPAADTDHVTATLRVSVRQAVYLTAAQNFAQEVRLLPRPTGDRSGAGGLSIAGSQL